MLLVSMDATEFLCMEKVFSVAKVIENYVALYHLKQERANPNESSHSKLVSRLKSFFIKATRGAFEIKVGNDESFARFKEVKDAS